MRRALPPWVSDNAETFFFSVVLALVVWLAGVNATDPIQEAMFPDPVAIEYMGPDEGLITTGTLTSEASLAVRAPRSVWATLGRSDLHLVADLRGLGAGVYTVPLEPSVDIRSARVRGTDPSTVHVTIEERLSRSVPVRVVLAGEPAARYRVGQPAPSFDEVTVAGPASLVNLVAEAVAGVTLSGQDATLLQTVDLSPRTATGTDVRGVTVSPRQVHVEVPISLPGGFRSVAVIPLVMGQVLPGYRVTNMTVSPPTVTVFATDPAAMSTLPGFVQTEAISLDDASQNIDRRVTVDLPEGFTLVDEQSVLVQVTIAPIESSLTITRRVEVVGLQVGLYARPSLESVSVILTGSLPELEQLSPEDVRVVLDLLSLGVGVHDVAPEVIVLPADVRVQTIIPDLIEVTVSRVPFATPTPLP
ncbi:MAG TPA: CdaR family protein [Anaerolineales bacterium]|nr:CdaR family protein [Anaerolineales bacterium]